MENVGVSGFLCGIKANLEKASAQDKPPLSSACEKIVRKSV